METVYSLTDPVFWFWMIVFLPVFTVSILIPAYGVVSRYIKDRFIILSLLIPVGFSLWAWQGYVGGYLHARWISYVYILIFLIIFLKNRPHFNRNLFILLKPYRILTVIIVLGVAVQLSSVFLRPCGIVV